MRHTDRPRDLAMRASLLVPGEGLGLQLLAPLSALVGTNRDLGFSDLSLRWWLGDSALAKELSRASTSMIVRTHMA